jgi:hypothetical protein
MIEACRLQSWTRRLQWLALKAIGIVIFVERKLLIVGDSVMGCLVQAPGDGDASSGAVAYIGPGCSRISPGRRANVAAKFAGPFLPAGRPVLF